MKHKPFLHIENNLINNRKGEEERRKEVDDRKEKR